MKKFYLMLVAMFVAIAAHADYYLVGGFNSWNVAQAEFKFTAKNDGSGDYVLDLSKTSKPSLTSGFKISQGNWSDPSFGAGGKLTVGQTYNLTLSGTSGNIETSDGNAIADAYLTFNPDKKTLLITGASKEVQKLYTIYASWAGWTGIPMTDVNGKQVLENCSVGGGEFGLRVDDKESGAQLEWYSYGSSITVEAGKEYTLVKDGSQNLKINSGVYTFTYDPATLKLSVATGQGEFTYPETVYVIGEVANNAWNPTQGVAMINEGDGIYTVENLQIKGGFALSTTLGTSDGDWGAMNAGRMGPDGENQPAIVGENPVVGFGDGKSWTIAPGYYNLTYSYDDQILEIEVGETPPPVIPEVIYLRGGAGDDSWGDNTANAMVKLEEMTGDGGYQYQAKFDAITDEFKFASDPISWDNLVLNMGAGDNRVATNHGTLVAVHDGQNFQVAEGGLKNVTVTFVYAPEGTSRVNFEAEEVVPTITLGDVTVSDITDATATITAAYTAENVVAPNAVFVEFTDDNTRQMTRVAGEDGKAELKLEGLTAETKYQYMVVARVLNTAEGYNTVTSSNINYPEFTTTAAPVVEPELGLKEVWKKENVYTATYSNVRSGTGVNGKAYFTDYNGSKKTYAVDANGISEFVTVDGVATGITSDDAGNIIVNRGHGGAGSGINMTVISADGTTQNNITLTMPEGVSNGMTMGMGRVIGDILSDEGGYFYLAEQNQNKVVMIQMKNGKQVAAKASKEMKYTFDATTVAHPILSMDEIAEAADAQTLATATKISDPENYFAVRVRGNRYITLVEGDKVTNLPTTWNADAKKGTSTMDGFGIFTLGGETYQVLPVIINSTGSYGNEFQLLNSKGEVLENFTLGNDKSGVPSYCGITARPVSETQAEIYIVYSNPDGQSAAMYTYTIEAPAVADPTLEIGEMTAETTATTATVTVNYTAENLPEGGKVVAEVMLNTDKRETVKVDGVDGKAVAEFTELAPETEYQYMVTAYVVDAEGNQNYETRRMAQNAFTTAKALTPATYADRVNASVEQDDKTFDYTLEYTITRNADKTLAIAGTYSYKGEAPAGVVDTYSIYIDQTANGGRIDMVEGVKDGEGATTAKTFEDGDVVYVNFAKAISGKNMETQVEYTVGSEQEMPVNYDITGNATSQVDMSAGQADEPELDEVKTYAVKAAYVDGKLTLINGKAADAEGSTMFDMPLTFVVNAEEGTAVSEEDQVAYVQEPEEEGDPQYTYFYTDIKTGTTVLKAKIENISEEPAKSRLTIEPFGEGFFFEEYDMMFYNVAYFNTVIELDYCFEGAPFVPTIAIDKAEASNVTRTTAVISVTPEFEHKPEGAKVIVSAIAEGTEAIEQEFEGESGESASILVQGLTENTEYKYTVNAVIKANDEVLAQAEPVEVTFTTEEAYTGEERTLVDKNVYAYDIKVVGDNVSKVATISYKLNGKTKEVKIQALIDGEPVTAADGVTEGTTNYDNEVEVAYPAEVKGTLTFEITAVPETTVEKPTLVPNTPKYYQFWSPTTIAVNNDPETETFGRVLTVENRYHNTPFTNSAYHAVGRGGAVYAFDPTHQPINAEDGKPGFKFGLKDNSADKEQVYGDYQDLRYAGNKLYFGSADLNKDGLYEIDPDDMDATAQPMFENGKDHRVWAFDTYTYADGSTKFVIAESNDQSAGQGNGVTAARIMIYDLGEDGYLTNGTRVAEGYSFPNGLGMKVRIDPDGQGFYVSSHRGDAKETEPHMIHSDMEGNLDVNDYQSTFNCGAMGYNHDNTLFARVEGNATVVVYRLSEAATVAAGTAPAMEKLTSFNAEIGNPIMAVAFDYANNIYVSGNNLEKFQQFQLPADIAGESATVPAPKAMAVDIDTTAVGNILVDAEDGNAVYYNLNGIQMPATAKLPAGVYVKVVGKTATKVVVK